MMAKASIPVDLHNPGQVFACMGLLEASLALFRQAEGGFNWANEAQPQFVLSACSSENPVRAVLEFLVEARIKQLAPPTYTEPPPKKKKKSYKKGDISAPTAEEEEASKTDDAPVCSVQTFPAPEADRLTLPVRLEHEHTYLELTHWCDGSSRNSFKLFAGQQRASVIVSQMLGALRRLWQARCAELIADPFGITVPLGGSSFKMDARKSWTPINAGYSPDEQAHAVEASPAVELLAAIGLEHARPQVLDGYQVRYGVWKGTLPPSLARAALGGSRVGVPLRIFRFTLAKAGQNKVVTFAQEEEGL
jgi:CRISPR-associated protein Csx14